MKASCEEITEIREVYVDVEPTFVYFDKLIDGTWRCVMSKDMKDKFILEKRK